MATITILMKDYVSKEAPLNLISNYSKSEGFHIRTQDIFEGGDLKIYDDNNLIMFYYKTEENFRTDPYVINGEEFYEIFRMNARDELLDHTIDIITLVLQNYPEAYASDEEMTTFFNDDDVISYNTPYWFKP